MAFKAGNYELAEHKCREAIALDPTNKQFRLAKGLCLENQRKWDNALREYDKLMSPDYGTAWTYKATVLNIRKLFEAAEMCAENALRLNNKDGVAWGEKGHALEMQHKLDEALLCFDEQIRLSPAEGWASKGLLLLEFCDYENAAHCFDKSLNLDGRNIATAQNGKG